MYAEKQKMDKNHIKGNEKKMIKGEREIYLNGRKVKNKRSEGNKAAQLKQRHVMAGLFWGGDRKMSVRAMRGWKYESDSGAGLRCNSQDDSNAAPHPSLLSQTAMWSRSRRTAHRRPLNRKQIPSTQV